MTVASYITRLANATTHSFVEWNWDVCHIASSGDYISSTQSSNCQLIASTLATHSLHSNIFFSFLFVFERIRVGDLSVAIASRTIRQDTIFSRHGAKDLSINSRCEQQIYTNFFFFGTIKTNARLPTLLFTHFYVCARRDLRSAEWTHRHTHTQLTQQRTIENYNLDFQAGRRYCAAAHCIMFSFSVRLLPFVLSQNENVLSHSALFETDSNPTHEFECNEIMIVYCLSTLFGWLLRTYSRRVVTHHRRRRRRQNIMWKTQ